MSISAYEYDFEVCKETGKRIYISRCKAHVYMQRIQRKNARNGDRHPVHVYRCECCQHWHIGHNTGWVKNRRAA